MAQNILMVGATGNLGYRVAQELVQRGKHVRALVRPGSDAAKLEQHGIEIARGDMTQPQTLPPALDGIEALVTTAIGYSQRQPGDSLQAVDEVGNRNLVDAAKAAGLQRFVFTSVLTADKAKQVPHFYQKKLIEDYLEASGVPFVSLRPGGFLETILDMNLEEIKKGRLRAMTDPDAKASTIHGDDVARYLALAVDEPRALGQRIPLGTDRPVSFRDIAGILSNLMDRPVKLQAMPGWLTFLLMRIMGLFNPAMREAIPSMKYVSSSRFIADTAQQRRIFGDVPGTEASFSRWVKANGLSKNSDTTSATTARIQGASS